MSQVLSDPGQAVRKEVVADPNDRFFRTDHLMADLKGRSVRGGAVTLTSQAIKFVLQTGSTMVLARLLTPADFGLVAMVAAFTGFVELFKDLGLSLATIQREKITHAQVSTLFWINVGLSVLLMFVAAVISPLVAWFYGEPRLTLITLAIGATFIFGGLTAQHTALLRRQMRFSSLAVIEIGSLIAGVAAAIILASLGAGYWALVAMGAAGAVATMLLTWAYSGWRPGFPRRGVGTQSLVAFGANLTAFNVLNYFTRNADNMLIGSVYGAAPLGIYSKAYGLLLFPISQINAPISAVVLPALSRLQHDPSRYRAYFRQAICGIASFGMPLVVFAIVNTEGIVSLILGQAWNEAVPIFRALGPAALLGSINVAGGWVLVSMGHATRQMTWGLLSAPVFVLGFLCGLPWGILGVSAAFSTTMVLLFVPAMLFAYRNSPIRLKDLFLAVLRPAAASIGSGLLLALYTQVTTHMSSGPLMLLASAVLFVGLYCGATLLLPGGRKYFATLVSTVVTHKKGTQ